MTEEGGRKTQLGWTMGTVCSVTGTSRVRRLGWKGQRGGILGWAQEPGEGLGVWKRHGCLPNVDARGAPTGRGPGMLQTPTAGLSPNTGTAQLSEVLALSPALPPISSGPRAAPHPALSHNLLNSQMRAVSDQMTHGPRAQPPEGSENGAGKVTVATSTTHPPCRRHMTMDKELARQHPVPCP